MNYRDMLGFPKKKVEKKVAPKPTAPPVTELLKKEFGPLNEWTSKPQKLKIDIPDSPFEPDVNQIKDKLKQMLKQWKVRQYPSDEIRWKLYYKDLLKLVTQLDGEK